MNRYYKHYVNIVRPDLINKLNPKNIYNIPKIEKIVVKTSIKNPNQDSISLYSSLVALNLITGLQPKITKSKKSIVEFNIRKHTINGGKVTLRNKDMFNFLDTLVSQVLPKIYNFNGISIKSFDGNGNLSLGISNILVFPEIEKYYFNFRKKLGIDITIITTAKNDYEALQLLSSFQIPFKK